MQNSVFEGPRCAHVGNRIRVYENCIYCIRLALMIHVFSCFINYRERSKASLSGSNGTRYDSHCNQSTLGRRLLQVVDWFKCRRANFSDCTVIVLCPLQLLHCAQWLQVLMNDHYYKCWGRVDSNEFNSRDNSFTVSYEYELNHLKDCELWFWFNS